MAAVGTIAAQVDRRNTSYTSSECKSSPLPLASSAAGSQCVDMNRKLRREVPAEILELEEAILKLKQGRRGDIDVIRMLELYEHFHSMRQDYFASMAAEIATQAAMPD